MTVSRVEDITKGAVDSTGFEILAVYAKVSGRYAVYRTVDQVMIQFADDDSEGVNQRAALAPLASLRSEVSGRITALRSQGQAYQLTKAEAFDRRLGFALATALQGDIQSAQAELLSLRSEMDEDRASDIRTRHLVYAAGATAGLILIAMFLSSRWLETAFAQGISPQYWNAAGVGALGAFFSISLQIRSRQVPIDLQPWDNLTDAILRIFVGAASAILLVALLFGDLVNFGIAGKSIIEDIHGRTIAAFAAGFAERLVADFLSGLSLSGRAPALTAGGVRTPPRGADEMTVAGIAAPAVAGPAAPTDRRAADSGPADSELLDEPDEEEGESLEDEALPDSARRDSAEPVG